MVFTCRETLVLLPIERTVVLQTDLFYFRDIFITTEKDLYYYKEIRSMDRDLYHAENIYIMAKARILSLCSKKALYVVM